MNVKEAKEKAAMLRAQIIPVTNNQYLHLVTEMNKLIGTLQAEFLAVKGRFETLESRIKTLETAVSCLILESRINTLESAPNSSDNKGANNGEKNNG